MPITADRMMALIDAAGAYKTRHELLCSLRETLTARLRSGAISGAEAYERLGAALDTAISPQAIETIVLERQHFKTHAKEIAKTRERMARRRGALRSAASLSADASRPPAPPADNDLPTTAIELFVPPALSAGFTVLDADGNQLFGPFPTYEEARQWLAPGDTIAKAPPPAGGGEP